MTPLHPCAYDGYTKMAQRDAMYKAPTPTPTPKVDEYVAHEELVRHLHFTAEALKAEFSQHCDNEIERFRAAVKGKP